MERLTTRIDGHAYGKSGIKRLSKDYHRGQFECTALVERLAEYEDAEEQGLLIRLPCKVGDTVYEPRPNRGLISEYVITSVEIQTYDNEMFFYWRLKDGIYSNLKGFSDFRIGKTVFLTYEDAEKKLEKIT